MSKLSQFARNQPCFVRIPNVCNGNAETVVLAHYRSAGLCGTGIKPHDLLGAYCCSDCHDAVDGRTWPMGYSKDQLRLWHAEGVLRTIDRLIRTGKVTI